MKTSILTILILFMAAGFIPNAKPKTQLPTPPDGYSWIDLKDVNASLLKPDGWFFNAEQKGNTYAYFITKEDYTKDPNGMFITGFSLNVFTNMGNTNAVDYANKFANQVKKQNELVFMKDHTFGNFKGKMLRIKNKGQIIHYIVIGNTKTNKLYLAYFESSRATWDANEEFGKTIMEFLAFDPEF